VLKEHIAERHVAYLRTRTWERGGGHRVGLVDLSVGRAPGLVQLCGL